MNWIISVRSEQLKPFNYVETIAIQMCKQINSNLFKNEINNKLLYIHLTVRKQMISSK